MHVTETVTQYNFEDEYFLTVKHNSVDNIQNMLTHTT